MQKLLPSETEIPAIKNRNLFLYFFKLKEYGNVAALKQQFAQAQAQCLHWWECEYTLIGKGEDFWTHAAIIEFSNFQAVEKAIKSEIKSEEVEHLQVFAVKPTKIPAFILFLFKLLRPVGALYRGPNETPTPEMVMETFEEEGGIAPNKTQVIRHLANTRKTKAYMINLLQSHPKAQYPQNESNITGATAYYRRYGLTALRSVIMTGGNLILSGRIGKPILETNAPEATKGAWEGIGIMEYPNPLKLFSLEKMPGYKKALVHRRAGLERTALIISKK